VVEGLFVPIVQTRNFLFCAAALVSLTGVAAAQDVQSGIAAWQAGDYAKAVGEWRPLADAGNADAQFNLGQAYRLGRGVPQNLNLAEQWFERAARQRHEQAGTSLGLLLFQNGRAREAMPWIQAAATRGDPRAQYVFGTALFNGDILRRDLPRAYAMMSAAAAQGFPQAQAQLAEMERQLSPADRDQGRAMVAQMGSPAGTQVAAAGPAPRMPRPSVTQVRPPVAGPVEDRAAGPMRA
jgi:TPR repeat protein